MGTLHQLPTAAFAHTRLLEQLVTETIAGHPDPMVAKAWAKMARQSISRYASPPRPSQPMVDLDSVEGLNVEQCEQLHGLTQAWLESYLIDVRDQLMSIHADLLSLQKRVAEGEVAGAQSGSQESACEKSPEES